MRHLLTLGAVLLLAGCATAAKYEASLNTYVGKPELDLVRDWGAPAQTYETGGSKFLMYSSRRTLVFPGTPPTYTTSYSGYQAYTTTTGGTPPARIPMSCETTFEVIDGKVSSWTYKGNDCTAM
ncbi:TPA: hypothetical protein N2A14_002569 [Pseudomonas aeruginosa]|nr:hypothetical protein [Pseudomonas aeruginosa]